MQWKVLISAPYFIPVADRFSSWFEENDIKVVIPPVQERLSEEELLGLIHDIHGVICGDDQFTAQVLHAAPLLKVISKWGTGIDSIDVNIAKQLGILVCRTPNAFTDPVADSVMAYTLSFARNIVSMDGLMKSGIWKKVPGKALRESTIGVIGVGAIGGAVLFRAHAFGSRLFGNDIRDIGKERARELHVTMVSLEELLQESDFVSINCDLNPTSYHIMNTARFSLMKNSAYLINCSRGPCVDERALIEALRTRQIAGAGLDVFEEEPLPMDSLLRRMSNVLLAPHSSNASSSARERVHDNTLKQLLDGLRNPVRS